MRARTLLAAALVAGLFAGPGVTGCASDDRRGERERVARLPEPDDALGEELMIALAQAKNFHHKAKVYIGDGNVPEAILAVRQILTLPFPPGAPEADDVRLDARALLAKLLVGRGELDEAQRVVDEGLASTTRPSFFVANLWTVAGEVHEARAAALTGPAAADERRQAIRAYDESIRINEALQKRLVEERP